MRSQDSNLNFLDKQWNNESFNTCWTIFEPVCGGFIATSKNPVKLLTLQPGLAAA